MGVDSKYNQNLEQRAKRGTGAIDFQWITEKESDDSRIGEILAKEEDKLSKVTNRIQKLRRENYPRRRRI